MENMPTTKREAWIVASRPRTLPLALSSIALGGFLAGADESFSWLIVLLSGLTMASMQILSNLANDYGDSIHGADSDARSGPKRVSQMGLLSREEMRSGMLVCAVLAVLFGLAALLVAFGLNQALWIIGFVVIGGAGIWAAIAYTATANPYGYQGLGDLFVFLFFGLIPTLGTYLLQNQSFSGWLLLPAAAGGLLATAVLNVNNVRDIDSDRLAGKRSIPVRIGYEQAIGYHWALLIVPYLLVTLYTIFQYHSPWQWLFLLTLPLVVLNGRAVANTPRAELDPMLKRTVLLNVLFVVLFGVGLLL